MLSFKQRHPPAGRIEAYSNEFMVGTIQPSTKPKIEWALDVPGHRVSGKANNETKAKQQLSDAFRDWCARAGLVRT